jgi:hypothetical protein
MARVGCTLWTTRDELNYVREFARKRPSRLDKLFRSCARRNYSGPGMAVDRDAVVAEVRRLMGEAQREYELRCAGVVL